MFKRAVTEIVGTELIALSPDEPLEAAIGLMREKRVSCVLAVDGDRVVGIMTERDLVKALPNGFDPAAPVRSLMSRPVSGIMENLTVEDACRMLTDGEIRHLAVLDARGALRGVITNSNVVDALAVEYMCENTLCSEIMNPAVVAVSPETPLGRAAELMVERRIGSVVAAEGDRPQGVVSERDLAHRGAELHGLLDRPISEFMSGPAVAVPPDGMVYKVILYMKQKKVRRVLIVDRDGRLLGIMSQSDLVKAYPRFL